MIDIVINGIDRSDKAFAQSRSNMIALEKVAKTAAISFALLAGAIATKAAKATVDYTKEAIDAADATGKMAQMAGVAVEDFSRLSYAASLSEVSTDQLKLALKGLSDEMVKAGKSNADVLETLLGAADEFAGMEDGAAKTTRAVQLFGKSGQALIPLLNQGSEAMREQMREADRFGLVIGSQFAGNADEFNDNLTRLKASMQGLWLQVAEQSLPALLRLSEALLAIANNGDFIAEKANTIATGFQALSAYARAALDPTKKLADIIGVDMARGLGDAIGSELGKLGGKTTKAGVVVDDQDLQRALRLEQELQASRATGSFALLEQNRLAFENQIKNIEKLRITEADKLQLTELAQLSNQEKITAIWQSGEAQRAEFDAAMRVGDIERFETNLGAMQGLRLLDLDKQREIMTLKQELFNLAHKTEHDKELLHLQRMLNLRKNWANGSIDALNNLATAAEAFGKKQNAAHKIFATASVIMSTAQAVMKIWEQWGWPLGAVFSGAAVAAGAAQISNISQAHAGLDYVPNESTFLLQRGERVVQPEANRDLTDFLSGGGGRIMNVEIHLDSQVLARGLGEMSRDGRLVIDAKAVV